MNIVIVSFDTTSCFSVVHCSWALSIYLLSRRQKVRLINSSAKVIKPFFASLLLKCNFSIAYLAHYPCWKLTYNCCWAPKTCICSLLSCHKVVGYCKTSSCYPWMKTLVSWFNSNFACDHALEIVTIHWCLQNFVKLCDVGLSRGIFVLL